MIPGFGVIIGSLVNFVISFAELGASQAANANPILSLAFLGSNLITLAMELWVVVGVATMAITSALSAVPCMSLGTIELTLTAFITPLLSGISLMLFVTGCLQAYYVPLIPLIVFTFSAIGWIIVVIEAMAAAPLVALGITHPEGHEVVGSGRSRVNIISQCIFDANVNDYRLYCRDYFILCRSLDLE